MAGIGEIVTALANVQPFGSGKLESRGTLGETGDTAECPRNLSRHALPEKSPASRRTYVGLSASWRRASIAIVRGGQILFAEECVPGLSAHDPIVHNENESRTLLAPIVQYCEPDTDVVIAVPSEGCSPAPVNVRAGSSPGTELIHPLTVRLSDSERLCREILPRSSRTAVYSRRSRSHVLSWLVNIIKLHILNTHAGRDARVELRYYRRHLAYAVAACVTSPYSEALCMVLEGSRRQPCSRYIYRDGSLFEIADVISDGMDEDLAKLYQDACEACESHAGLDEHTKVMSLAAQGGAEQENMARTAQAAFEETLYSLLRNLGALGRFRNLAFTGGCALNSLANGNILQRTEFESLYVPCFPSNTGNAVGAALLAHHQDNRVDALRHPGFQTPYLGSDIPSARFHRSVSSLGLAGIQQCSRDAPEQAARYLASGMVVGWLQGRAEFGPRALGNRSILADPRQQNIKARLSSSDAVDSRVTWPSFSVLHEYGGEWFENYQVSPYMERALRFRAKAIRRIPGVINETCMAQVQSVKRDWNQRFYELILCFYKITGIPIVINANCELLGRGFVTTPDEILRVFIERQIDVMFVDEIRLEKQQLWNGRGN